MRENRKLFWQKAFKSIEHGGFQGAHIFGSEMEMAKQCQLNHKMIFTIRYEGLWLGTQMTELRSVRLCILKLWFFGITINIVRVI